MPGSRRTPGICTTAGARGADRGFYHHDPNNRMTAELPTPPDRLFPCTGPLSAYVVGGGDWTGARSRRGLAGLPAQAGRLRALEYRGTTRLSDGTKSAPTGYWEEDRKECERQGDSGSRRLSRIWLGQSHCQKPGASNIPRRRGAFLWEQFVRLARMGGDTAYVAMFDEVDEGTAIFKVTSDPPTQAHFVGYEGLPATGTCGSPARAPGCCAASGRSPRRCH